MSNLNPEAQTWLCKSIGSTFTAKKHIHSHQDEVYRIQTPTAVYYLKMAPKLGTERNNLSKLAGLLPIPQVIAFYTSSESDYLLISELPGKNLVELIGEWSVIAIVETFAKAIREMHAAHIMNIFPQAHPTDVLLHGDMSLPNIIISSQGKIDYIDFGQMSHGTPELDITDALWGLQRNIGPEYGELFLQKYGPVVITPKIRASLAFRYQP